MRVKILDAWSWGLPVISTSIGAEGIAAKHGENILISDDPETFANHIIAVLSDSKESAALSVNGRNWVENSYDWRKIYPKIDELYRHLLVNKPQS